MIEYKPTTAASTINNSTSSRIVGNSQQSNGLIPFTPGQTAPSQPTAPTPSPQVDVPGGGTVNNDIVNNKGFVGNTLSNIATGLNKGFTGITNSEQAVGGELVSGLPASITGEQQLNQANQQSAASDTAFIKAINAKVQSGQTLTAAQQQMYKSILATHSGTGMTQTDLLPHAADTNEQAIGNVIGVGADILSAGALETGAKAITTPAEGVLQGALQGAKAGAKAGVIPGAIYGLSGGLKVNESAGGVVGSTLFGALTGAVGGSIAGGTIGAIKANPKIITNYDSAIKDVTPSFDAATPTQKTDLLPRTQEGGIFTGRKVVSTTSEHDAAAALASIDGYNSKATALEKSQLANNEIANEAQQVRTSLANSGVIVPKKQMISTVTQAIKAVPENSLLLQSSDPVIENYVRVATNAAQKVDGTALGILDYRQALDEAYNNARGKLAFNSDKISALDEVHTAARDAVNRLLIENAPNTAVKTSFQYQSALYRAKDVLDAKAVKEAGSSVARVLQTLKQHPYIGAAATAAGVTGILNKFGL